MTLVAGIDSSTQSCKVVVRDLQTGNTVRTGSAKHPEGTEVDPNSWLEALRKALELAGGLADVAAISIAAQQHGMVALDESGEVIRPALLWNDTRSASAADQLLEEFGKEAFLERTGSLPVASFTITKLRWLRDTEPENASSVAAVALPHDWLTWRLRGFGPENPDFSELFTDRSDASGTGYFNPKTDEYERDLLIAALGHDAILPKVRGSAEKTNSAGLIFGAGAGDNAAAALGLGLESGDVVISIGTSGTVFASSETPITDATGTIANFADASGGFLPIAVTLNAARVLQSACEILGVNFEELAELALSAEPGSGGLVLTPYFEGERTPNLPNAKATLRGMSLASTTRPNLARAFIEGMLCGLAAGLDALKSQGLPVNRILFIGGAAQNVGVQQVARTIFEQKLIFPSVSEYVAEGAAAQAAWCLSGSKPNWKLKISAELDPAFEPKVLAQYRSQL